MAETEQDKSRGLKFAERQMLRHGWEQGKGLGREENGIVDAIKVKVKCDKGGVGHKQGEQFTFHWWDHVFNKASASLQVESDQNGVSVKKTVEDEEDGMISNKKPRKATLAKAKLYGCFVKSATLLSGQEQPEPKASSSDDSSSSDDEDQKLDLSSTTNLSDADLMKACGGRTAHKGARHGLTMNAKLARLERQEAEFMAKYGSKSQSGNSSPGCATPTVQSAAQSPEREEEVVATEPESRRKKSKKMKKKRSSEDPRENATLRNGDIVSESVCETDSKPKKKKRKKGDNSDEAGEDMTVTTVTREEESNPVGNGKAEHSLTATTKRKKKKKNKEENGEVQETTTAHTPESESAGVTEEKASPEHQTDADTKTTKKKKKKKSSSNRCAEPAVPEEVERRDDTQSSRLEPVQDPVAKKTKKVRREHRTTGVRWSWGGGSYSKEENV